MTTAPPVPPLQVEALDAAGQPIDAFTFDLAPGQPEGGRQPVTLTCRYDGTAPRPAGIRVRLPLQGDGERPPWWLVPGAFYGVNRPPGSPRPFPAFGPDDPDGLTSRHWEFRADRCATPAVLAWPRGRHEAGAGLQVGDRSPLGMPGLGWRADEQGASIWGSFPFREEPVSYNGSARPDPPEQRSHLFRPGETVRLDLAVWRLAPCPDGYAAVLRQAFAQPAPVRPWVDVADTADLAAYGLLHWHYDPDPGVLIETAAFDRATAGAEGAALDRQAMHVGWVSGIPWAYALLRHGLRTGEPQEVDAATAVLDFVCDHLSPSGTFYGVWYRDKGWRQSWSPVPLALHARTLGEAVLFLVRTLTMAPELAEQHPSWRVAVQSHLQVMTARQRPDGNLGALHDLRTGEVLDWEGAAPMVWIAALCEAAAFDTGGALLGAAVRAGEYYRDFIEADFVNGAAEDVDLAPTSEDGYLAVLAMTALYRRTGEARWLTAARHAADWTMTFRYSYNVAFDPHTLLAQYDFASRGADQASPCNQHLHAYGLIAHDELHQLALALDDPWYAERADETLRCFRQFIARTDGDFNARRGMAAERYYQTACFQPKGSVLTLSHAWSVGALLLACEQELSRRTLTP